MSNGPSALSPQHREQLDALVAALRESLPTGDLPGFYRRFRESDLPFVPVRGELDTGKLFRFCYEVLHRLGSVSPAVALAVENHYYVTSALATFPAGGDPVLDARRDALLESVRDNRWLVANTNSKVHGNKLGAVGTYAKPMPDGFAVNGSAAYTSLATEGDLLVFITQILDQGPGVFAIAPMQDNPAIEIGPYLFPSAMLDSDTRRITFHDLELPADSQLIDPANSHAELLFAFEMAWHQLLIPALYLGGAAGALEEVRTFLRDTQGRDGKPLAELDGMVIDIGRLAIDYRSACQVLQRAGERLAEVRRIPEDADLLAAASAEAGVAKYVGTRRAEEVVTVARRIVGARTFTGGHLLERLSQEIMFGPLGPEVSAVIERRLGTRALDDQSFLNPWW
ncbi:acyl-CoA dehydrogenase family protein [Amycolatopsis cihanbeyliensis]|uniref:Alkylation response protein AidB-like acyl-CoA dehydrogenase n=1 Tax=Amycolatopsis cihanbeyliensis TaxID=1128664 RepID=A0A542DBK3_AMYCI|nr:acyl-CoA dehydrogenase family protein [Amycolatopsis cihanbeyliensis]TQJ00435.1 alkylation response protein AidB-like acyl-CoA dehydrogenase [Amycolatopsis cihanbeyliensis]